MEIVFMKPGWRPFRLFLLIIATLSMNPTLLHAISQGDRGILAKTDLDLTYTLAGLYKGETFYGKNLSFLNSSLECDQIFYNRHIIDFNLDVLHGKKTYGITVAEFMFSLRNKAIWGSPGSIAPTINSDVKILDWVTGSHRHALPRQIFWMREGWLRFSINHALNLPFANQHLFTLGAFPFELGRGISLGSAYAVGPELLGFYSESIIDQYAFGALISGEILRKTLFYDIYVAILENKCATLGDTCEKIRGQEYGRLQRPARGFGRVNYLTAGRLKIYPLADRPDKNVMIEPYWLYNNDPEQKVEFLADAESKLATFGLMFEYGGPRVEFGFETAFNIGRQKVRAWDRNQIHAQNREGKLVFVNSQVVMGVDPCAPGAPANLDPYKVPQSTITISPTGQVGSLGRKAQEIIDGAAEDESNNGEYIGTVPGYSAALGDVPAPVAPAQADQLYNAPLRFRNENKNTYNGWFFVIDGSWLLKPSFQVSVAAGVASGDTHNPNHHDKDYNYRGFIGLQEIYTGKRVRSAFLLGGAGKIKRILSAPFSERTINPYAPTITGFTNLVHTGAGFHWKPEDWARRFSLNPNILFYWQEQSTPKFDIATKRDIQGSRASKFLGVELNTFTYTYLLKDLKLYGVGSLYLAGDHYYDIEGKPLNREQARELDKLNTTGFRGKTPNINHDPAFTLNIGLEWKF